MNVKTQKNKGVTLLEMMFVLTIVAVLAVLATRYYEITRSSALVNEAIKSIQAIYAAEQQYCSDNICSSSNLTLAKLKSSGLLPAKFTDYANPWGTITTETYDAATHRYSMTFTNVPYQACNNLMDKITTTYDSTEIKVSSPTTCPDKGVVSLVIDFFF